MNAARDSAAQVLHPADQNGKLGVIIRQGSSPGLDSMEHLTFVSINATDVSVICPTTVLTERLTTVTHSWTTVKSKIHHEATLTGKQLRGSAGPTGTSGV